MKPTVATFFSGAGGACCGLEQAGFEVIWGNEYYTPIADIWAANHPNAALDRSDIHDLLYRDIPGADLYWFSPPCPEFSGAKQNRTGGTELEDISIALKVAVIIRAKKPRWAAIENVPDYANSRSFARILVHLQAEGYNVAWAVLNAADYGVPQNRKRLILVAHYKNPTPILPLAIGQSRGWHGVLQSLIPSLAPFQLTPNQEKAIFHRGKDQLSLFPEGQWLLLQQSGYSDAGPQVVRGDQPCWTITASQGSESMARASTPRNPGTIYHQPTGQSWLMDTRCIARLQGFPDSYNWLDKPGIANRAIGNAVPVQLAAAIGRSLLSEKW